MKYLPDQQIYRFDEVEVDCARGRVLLSGVERHLRQQAFQVLVYLLEREDRLVSKDELFEAVWKNMAVTDDVLVQCIKEIRRTLGDDPYHPRFIKTVPKSGYRFIGSVQQHSNGSYSEEITRVEFEIEEESNTGETQQAMAEAAPRILPVRKSHRRYLIAASLISACAVAAIFFFGRQPSPQTADIRLPQIDGRKTIAVMFFDNQSNSAEFDWLREGLADMLITNLARSENLTLLSRQQLQLLLERTGYKNGAEINLERALEVAQKSGAEIIVVGSFARLGETMRLDVRLHDAKTGGLEGAESLTVEKPEHILTGIDLLSFKLINRFGAGEQETKVNLAAAMTDNLEAYRSYSLALEKAQGLHKTETLELLEKAIKLDPEFAMAHARIGHTYAVTWGWAEKAKPYLHRAFELSGRLTEKDRLYILAWYAIANLDYPAAIQNLREIISRYPAETEAYLRLGYLLRGEERFEESITALRQGLAIDPESSALYNALGLLYSQIGMHAEAISMHERYVALAPNEPNSHDSLGMSYHWAGRYNEAIAEYNRALELNPDFEIAYAHQGVAYFQTGRYAAAIVLFKKYVAAAPSEIERGRGHAYIAHVYRKLRNPKPAIRAAQQAANENEVYAWERVAIAAEAGDRATVKKLEQRLFADQKFTNRGSRRSPRYPSYYTGYIALKNGQTDKALDDFAEALRHSPATWEIDPAEDCLANAYLELGRFDEAIAEYQRILQLNPNYPLARFRLAEAYQARGLSDQARASYQIFLQIWKDADADIPEIAAARKFVG